MESIEDQLRDILGGTYGGPSIAIEGERFVIYEWSDAPVGMDVMAQGDTLSELVEDYKKNFR